MSNYDPGLVGAVTDKGLYRLQNEDACWQPDHTTPVHLGALYIVADGVGGQEHGGMAARIVTAVLSEAFYRAREQGQEIPDALRYGITQANQAVYDEAQLYGVRMGATVVTAVQHQGQLFLANVGDSRAYLLHEQALTQLTRDDSLVQEQLDAGVITPAEAAQHQFRNLVTQVLGNTLSIDIHQTAPQPFAAHDTLILCTDGLSGVLPEAELAAIVAENPAPAAARALVEAAKQADSQDNITAVVVNQSEFQAPLVPMPAAADKPRRERSVWVWAALVLLLIVVSGMLWWWRGQPAPAEQAGPGSASEAVILPTTDDASLTSTPTAPAATPAAQETAVIAADNASSTAEIVSESTPEPVTPAVTNTPTPQPTQPATGCVSLGAYAFVWAKEDLQPETCANAVATVFLNPGEPVVILEETPESLSASGGCLAADFIEIQAQNDDTIQGWVLDSDINKGDACP